MHIPAINKSLVLIWKLEVVIFCYEAVKIIHISPLTYGVCYWLKRQFMKD